MNDKNNNNNTREVAIPRKWTLSFSALSWPYPYLTSKAVLARKIKIKKIQDKLHPPFGVCCFLYFLEDLRVKYNWKGIW